MGSSPVAVPRVPGQDSAQAPFTEDQHPAGDLGAGGEHEPLRAGVRAGPSGRDLHGLDAGTGQDRVERGRELPGPVPDQEPEVRGATAGRCCRGAGGAGPFGPVASDPVVSRLVARLAGMPCCAAGDPLGAVGGPAAGLGAGRGCRARRGRRLIQVDVDATIVTAYSDQYQAAPAWKKSFGFHPLTVFADHGPDGSGEPLEPARAVASGTDPRSRKVEGSLVR